MSKEEKQKAREIADKLQQLPDDAKNFVRGYMQGIVDAAKRGGEEDGQG